MLRILVAAPLPLLPLPIRELFAQGDFLKFADRGAGNFSEENEGVRELPFGEGLR